MTQPNKHWIENIEQAVEKASDSVFKVCGRKWLRALLKEVRSLQGSVMWWQQKGMKDSDLMERILEENKRLQFGTSFVEPLLSLQTALQQTREELELAKRKHDNLFISASFIKGEFEQVKAELDKLREEAKTPLQRGMDAIRIIGEFNNEVKP